MSVETDTSFITFRCWLSCAAYRLCVRLSNLCVWAALLPPWRHAPVSVASCCSNSRACSRHLFASHVFMSLSFCYIVNYDSSGLFCESFSSHGMCCDDEWDALWFDVPLGLAHAVWSHAFPEWKTVCATITLNDLIKCSLNSG